MMIAAALAVVAVERAQPRTAERLAVPAPLSAPPSPARPAAATRLRAQAPEPTSHRPGRAIPHALAEPATYDVLWNDGHGRSWRTRIRILADGDGLRRSADIATREADASLDQVFYRGTAFRGSDGRLHIDAREAIVSGPFAHDWSPDSFAIADDLSVVIQDDRHDASSGHVTQITR